jgi:periplasmic protein TonB
MNAIEFKKLNDEVFEARNKGYGAFEARQAYPKHLLTGFLIGSTTVGLLIAAPLIISMFKPADEISVVQQDVEIDLDREFVIEKIEQVKTIQPPKAETVKFLPPEVKPDAQVPEEEIATVDQLENSNPGSETHEGEKDIVEEQVAAPPPPPEEPAKPEIVTWAPVMPVFPGGEEAFIKYINKNINYPRAAIEADVEGKVFVSFLVNPDGSITDVHVAKGKLGFGLEEEAVKVIKNMPKWAPGKQNEKSVYVRLVRPITFKLE